MSRHIESWEGSLKWSVGKQGWGPSLGTWCNPQNYFLCLTLIIVIIYSQNIYKSTWELRRRGHVALICFAFEFGLRSFLWEAKWQFYPTNIDVTEAVGHVQFGPYEANDTWNILFSLPWNDRITPRNIKHHTKPPTNDHHPWDRGIYVILLKLRDNNYFLLYDEARV